MELKVGDKVLIKNKSWYDAVRNSDGHVEFKDGPSFVRTMTEYCGKILTVDAVFDRYFKAKEGRLWNFAFESIETILPIEKNMNTVPSIIPKVGDYVRIKDWDWYDKYKNGEGYVNVKYSFTSKMTECLGKVYKVKRNDDGCFTLSIDNKPVHWSFSLEMFDEVIPKKEYERSKGSGIMLSSPICEETFESLLEHLSKELTLKVFQDCTSSPSIIISGETIPKPISKEKPIIKLINNNNFLKVKL